MSIPNALYDIRGNLSGVLYNYVEGNDLHSLLKSDGLIREKIYSGIMLGKDLDELHKRGLMWGDIRMCNIVLKRGNCYGIDVDEIHKPNDDKSFYSYYYLTYQGEENEMTDNVKYVIAMLSYIWGLDLEKLIKDMKFNRLIKMIGSCRSLEEVADRLKNSDCRYEDIYSLLLKKSDEELEKDKRKIILRYKKENVIHYNG